MKLPVYASACNVFLRQRKTCTISANSTFRNSRSVLLDDNKIDPAHSGVDMSAVHPSIQEVLFAEISFPQTAGSGAKLDSCFDGQLRLRFFVVFFHFGDRKEYGFKLQGTIKSKSFKRQFVLRQSSSCCYFLCYL